jgi:hypothetical protein
VKKRHPQAIPIPQITTLAEADAHQRRHGFKPLTERIENETGKSVGKAKGRLRNVRKRVMNKTEREFDRILEARLRTGEIVEKRYEGVRLLWGGGMTYTADFSARRPDGKIEIHEVKGAHIFDRDTVRFKGCRAEWEQWFIFAFHQRNKDGTWTRLL